MSHLKYIFFDLDGTLVDSSKGIQESFEYSFKQLGKECPEESIIKSFMGPPLEVSFASVLEERQVPEAINYYRSFYKEKGITGSHSISLDTRHFDQTSYWITNQAQHVFNDKTNSLTGLKR